MAAAKKNPVARALRRLGHKVKPSATNERTKPMPRPIHDIAAEITRTWPKPYFGAVPYLGAMRQLMGITSTYGADSAKSVISYFLSNASTWRGPDAKRIKAELKELLK